MGGATFKRQRNLRWRGDRYAGFCAAFVFLFFAAVGAESAQESADENDASESVDALFDETLAPLENENENEPTGEEFPEGVRKGNLLNFVDRNQRTYAIDILAAVDMVGEWDNEEPHTTGNEFVIREVELGFFADIDQWAQGTVMMAAHNEGGEYVYELHEAYFNFPRFFVPNLSARAGSMFFDVGHLNSTHRHDWHFTQAPVVHAELLDEEAASDTGLELSYLMPWPFWQELTVGVFNGKTFGHSHVQGPIKNNPLYTAHLKQFIPFTHEWGTQFGFSYLRWHPTEEPHKVTHQSGLDVLVKWTGRNFKQAQLLSEIWYRETREKNRRRYDPPATPIETRVGGYVFAEFRFDAQWAAGYRYDLFTNPNYQDVNGRRESRNGVEQHSIMLTYYPSEFSYFRLTGERETIIEKGENSYQFYLQADFIIGKHPPHKY